MTDYKTEQQYSAQLYQERQQKRMRGLKEKAKAKVSSIIVGKMVKAANDGKTWIWPLVILLALLNDFVDFLIIGSIPIIGDIFDIFTLMTLSVFLYDIGGHIRMKVRILILLAGFFELIPFVDILPVWTISILWSWYVVRKRGKLAEKELQEIKRGKINNEAIGQFS